MTKPMILVTGATGLIGNAVTRQLLRQDVHVRALAHREDARGVGAPTNHVLSVTGRSPEDFETVARRYAALPAVRRSFGNRLRAVTDLFKMLFTPAMDVARYKREQQFPRPASRHYNDASPTWGSEHEVMAATGFAPAAAHQT